jgi:hypothetical protein
MGFYGGCIFAPLVVPWYKILDTRIVSSNVKKQLAGRVAADQLLFAPFGLTLFFGVMGGLKGESPVQNVREKWWDALKANWMVWPAVQAVNFGLVPLQYRILFVNVISIGECPRGRCGVGYMGANDGAGWNAYLAAAQGGKKVEAAEEPSTVRLATEAVKEKAEVAKKAGNVAE